MAVAPAIERSNGGGGQVLSLVISISVLAVLVPGALVFTIPDTGRSSAWVITILITVWGGIRLSVLWVWGIPKLFDYFFWLYTYVFMGLAASVQLRSGNIAGTTPGMNPSLDMPTAWVVLLGVASYEVGRLLPTLLRRGRTRPDLRPAIVSTPRSVLLYLVGLLGAAYYLSKVGVKVAIVSRDTAGRMALSVWPEPATLAIVLALAVYPLLVATGAISQVLRRTPRGTAGRLGWGMLMIVGMVALLAVTSPISSARYTFGTVAFAIVVYAGAITNRKRARLAMGGMIAAMLFLFPIADAFRRDTPGSISRTGFFGEYAGNADYDSFWQIANAYSYVLSGHMEPMRQLMGSLFFWVPRVLWPNKPTDTGILLANFRSYSFTNLSAPLWAEFLVNGGVLLVGVGFIVVGAFLAYMDLRMVPAHYHGGWWALVGAIMPVYMMILLRGSLLQATGAVFVSLACLLWVRKREPTSTDPPTVSQSLTS